MVFVHTVRFHCSVPVVFAILVTPHSVCCCFVFGIPVQNKVTALCKENWDWLTLHSGISAEQIATHQDDFDLPFAPYMSKLQPIPD